jgi:hypothetical protein
VTAKVIHIAGHQLVPVWHFGKAQFIIEGSFIEKWARVGNSIPPLFMRAIAGSIRCGLLKSVDD